MLKAGDKAPAFTAKDHLGRSVSLDGLTGKTVVLWFYPKADTPGCTAEGCSFRDLAEEFAKKNAVILGVSFDSVADNKAFADKFEFPFALLCDTERSMGVAYGAADDAKATTARRAGVVIGPDGHIREYHPKVDARTFPTDVIQRL
jgi:thioredoxin-dependent peroxiredoxin